MDSAEVTSMMKEAGIKVSQLWIIKKHTRHIVGTKVMSKEESARAKMKELKCTDFIKFESQ